MQNTRFQTWAQRITMLAIGVFAGLWLAQMSSGEARLQDWQTLITGFLAVAAAYFTIGQMEITDRRAQNRHLELVRLSLRADRLRVERAQYFSTALLIGRSRIAKAVQRILAALPADNPLTSGISGRDLHILQRAIDGVAETAAHPSVGRARSLFGPELLELHDQLARPPSIDQMRATVEAYFLRKQKDSSIEHYIIDFANEAWAYAGQAEVFAAYLDALRSEYAR